MDKRIPIVPPLRGLSDNLAYSEQEPGTTRDGRNVRGIDAPTGRTRLSQRAGSRKFNSTVLGGSHVQDLAVVTRDSPKIDYANIASLSSSNVEWSSVSAQEGTTWWPEADFQGNVVLLDGNNQLAKYNADGVLLRTIPVLAPQGGSVVRKVQVDVDGGVYVCGHAPDYSSGTLWRFVESATDPLAFEEDWSYTFTNEGPVMFAQRGNTLYVATKPSTGFAEYKLNRLDGGVTGAPTLGTSTEVPGPVNALEVSARGTVWLAADANAARGAGPDSEGVTKIIRKSNMMTPHDLPNADQRLIFWTRADNIDGSSNSTLTDGDEVTAWADNRFADTDATTVKDTTDRGWVKDDNVTPADRRPGPTYRATGWAGYPCIEFDGTDVSNGASALAGQALVTADNNSSNAKKTSGDALLAAQHALFPGQDDAQFVTCFLVKIDPTTSAQGPACLLSQYAEGAGGPGTGGGPPWPALSYGIVTNALWDTGAVGWSASEALLRVKGNGATAAMSGGTGDGTSNAQAAEGAFDTVNGFALITLVNYGINGTEASEIRINGVRADSFTFLADQNFGTNCGLTIMGSRRKSKTENTDIEFFRDADAYVGFSGKVVEAITMLSDSSAGASASDTHDLGIPHASAAILGLSGAFMVGQETGRIDPEGASVVEILEGILGHWNGVSHVLPNGAIDDAQSGVYPGNHPFGGTGNYPVRPGATVTRADHALWSAEPILAAFTPSGLEVIDAISGSGVGYSLATDEDGDCVAVGPRSALTGFGVQYGVDGQDDDDVIARKIAERTGGMAFTSASSGTIRLVGYRDQTSGAGAAMPSDGDQVVIDDGVNPAVTFEFDSDASVVETSTLRQVVSSGAVPSVIVGRLVTAINAAPALDVTARQNGPFVCEVFNDTTGVLNDAISVAVGGTRIEVTGLSGGATVAETWRIENASDAPDTAGLRMAFDDNGDLWVPQLLSGAAERVTKLDGATGLEDFDPGAPVLEYHYDLDSAQEATGVALPLSHPSYLGSSPVPTGPLFMYVTSTGGELATQEDNIRNVRIISETPDFSGAKTPRATRYLGVVGGVVKEFDNTNSVTTKSGGTLSSTSPYISSVVMTNKVVWTDGTQYLVYDAQTDVLKTLVSSRGGSFPRNCRILANWNDRLLLGRGDDDPYVIYGTRRGDITDIDEFPAVTDYLEAFSTPNSIAGKCPDIVNAMIPVADDLCLIGGDHSIFRLTGDPTGGGQFDLLSDTIGIAYGYPFARDPSGAVYFVSTQGHVYRTNGEELLPVSRERIPRRIANLDFATYRMVMAYNHEAEEIEIVVVPLGAPSGTPPLRWALDKNGSWWEDDFATLGIAPTAIAVADGDDPNDRVLLYGCGDGYVRKWDKTARSDDGERINSYVYIGPIGPTNTGREAKFLRPQIALASDQQGCNVEFYASDTPELIGTLKGTARLGPGQNPRLPIRGRGTAMYVRLHNGSVDERWSMEQGTVGFAPAGRTRVR